MWESFFGEQTTSPWRELNRLKNEVNRLFYESPYAAGRSGGEYPPINLWTNDDKVLLTAELPGLRPQDIDITAHRNTVTIKGTREAEKLKESEGYHRRERPAGAFVRTLELPFNVDSERVNATYAKGVLVVELVRPESEKPRKINVKVD